MQLPFEPYSGNEPYAFMSYSHGDKECVYPELLRLHAIGYRVWYDKRIRLGEEWRKEIADAIEGCAVFLVFVSPGAVKSKWVQREIYHADSHDKRIVAVHLADTELPGDLAIILGRLQAGFLYGEHAEECRKKVESALAATRKCEGRHKPAGEERLREPRRAPSITTLVTDQRLDQAATGFKGPTGNASSSLGLAGLIRKVVELVLGACVGLGTFLIIGGGLLFVLEIFSQDPEVPGNLAVAVALLLSPGIIIVILCSKRRGGDLEALRELSLSAHGWLWSNLFVLVLFGTKILGAQHPPSLALVLLLWIAAGAGASVALWNLTRRAEAAAQGKQAQPMTRDGTRIQ
ncbi:MAG: TIR domain-containing protein [Thermodesulfobacteriota bacterium]